MSLQGQNQNWLVTCVGHEQTSSWSLSNKVFTESTESCPADSKSTGKMKRIAVIAIAAAGFVTPALAADGPSFEVPVSGSDGRPVGPSYVVPVYVPADHDGSPAYRALASSHSSRTFSKTPPVIAAAFSWTGCYMGGHIGGARSNDMTMSSFGTSNGFSAAGLVGGGQIGCDYQFASRWVVGIEGRAAATSLQNTHAATVTNLITGVTIPANFTLNNDILVSATGRLGYSFTDRWLVYARGGSAWTREKADDAFTTVRGTAVDPSTILTRSGWTIGAGVDWAFAPCWSATLEYNYYDFGTVGIKLADTANNVTVSGLSLKDTIHAVTAGVNFHF
jgi:outer membrane immunogenic protein